MCLMHSSAVFGCFARPEMIARAWCLCGPGSVMSVRISCAMRSQWYTLSHIQHVLGACVPGRLVDIIRGARPLSSSRLLHASPSHSSGSSSWVYDCCVGSASDGLSLCFISWVHSLMKKLVCFLEKNAQIMISCRMLMQHLCLSSLGANSSIALGMRSRNPHSHRVGSLYL